MYIYLNSRDNVKEDTERKKIRGQLPNLDKRFQGYGHLKLGKSGLFLDQRTLGPERKSWY